MLSAGPAFAAGAPVYLSKGGSFVLSLPAGYEPRFTPEIRLDIIGWQLARDHSIAGAVWHMNPVVPQSYGFSGRAAAEYLRATHMCGQRNCNSIPVMAYPLPHGGTLFYYELADPTIPADRGVFSGIFQVGREFYRVQGVNYSALNGTRDDLFKILQALQAATPELAAAAAPPPGETPGGAEWGIRFSGESDLSLMQDMYSAQTVTTQKDVPPERLPPPAALPEPKPAPKPAARAAALPPRPVPKTRVAAAPPAPQTLPPAPAAPVRPAAKAPAAEPVKAPPRRAPDAVVTAPRKPAPETFPAAAAAVKPVSRRPPVARRPAPARPAAPPKAIASRAGGKKESFPALSPIVPREVRPAPSAAALEDLDDRLIHDPLPDLIDMLRHENPRVRARAADILGERGEAAAEAVPGLTAALGDKDARVRSSAAMALGNIGRAALPARSKLRKLASDPNADARISARTALERLDGR